MYLAYSSNKIVIQKKKQMSFPNSVLSSAFTPLSLSKIVHPMTFLYQISIASVPSLVVI